MIPSIFNKKTTIFTEAVLIALLLTLISCKPSSDREVIPEGNPIRAITVFVTGDVHLLKGKQKDSPLHPGDIVQSGDQIKTVEGSADISFNDSTVIRVRPHTTVSLDFLVEKKKDGANAFHLSTKHGSILSHIKKLDKFEEFIIRSPTAIASVRGTTFEFRVEEDASIVHVADGMVEVQSREDRSRQNVIQKDGQIRVGMEKDARTEDPRHSQALQGELDEILSHMKSFGADTQKMTRQISEATSEEDLKKIFNKDIEVINMIDGRKLRGVVVAIQNGKLLIQTIEGSHIVNESEVATIQFVEE